MGVVGGDLDTLKTRYMRAQARGGHGEASGVVLVARDRIRRAGKGAEVKDAPEEGPAIGYIGDEDSSAGFADIPKRPDGAEGLGEGVILVEGSAEDL